MQKLRYLGRGQDRTLGHGTAKRKAAKVWQQSIARIADITATICIYTSNLKDQLRQGRQGFLSFKNR